LPEQIELSDGDTETVSDGVTVTITVAVSLHPDCVPVTVYVIVDVGDADTVLVFVALRPVDGLHE
jgi:hypothetical protein